MWTNEDFVKVNRFLSDAGIVLQLLADGIPAQELAAQLAHECRDAKESLGRISDSVSA